jgi:hypothetical protein
VEELESETIGNSSSSKRHKKGEFSSKDEEAKEPRKR